MSPQASDSDSEVSGLYPWMLDGVINANLADVMPVAEAPRSLLAGHRAWGPRSESGLRAVGCQEGPPA